jgi:hypothetical protein
MEGFQRTAEGENIMTELPHAEKYGNNEQTKNLRQKV